MTTSYEESSSKIVMPIPTTVEMFNSQYKHNVEKMSEEMFNIHTSSLTANEEVGRLTSANDELVKRVKELELLVVGLQEYNRDDESQEEKLGNIKHSEKALSAKIDKNELELRSSKDSLNLTASLQQLHTKSFEYEFGLDYNISISNDADVVK